MKNTIPYLSRLLCMKWDNPDLNYELKYMKNNPVQMGEYLGFEVKYQGETKTFSPEELLAMYFTQLTKTINKNNINQFDVAITIPD